MFNNTFNRRELENIIVCPFKNISHGLKTLKICRKLPKEANIINVLVLFVEHVGKAGQDDFHEGDEQATTAWLERSMVLKIVARLPHCDFNIPFSFYKLVF